MRDINELEEQVVHYQQTGDPEILEQLTASYMPVIKSMAYRYHQRGLDPDELTQEAYIGFLKAIDTYDAERGAFKAHMFYYARSEIFAAARTMNMPISLPNTESVRKMFTHYGKAERDLGAHATDAEYATKLGVNTQAVQYWRRLISASWCDALHCGKAGEAELEVYRQQVIKKVRAFGESLSQEREKIIFFDRMIADDPLTLREIADRIGVSRERARQLEMQLRDRLAKRCKHIEV